MMAEKVESTPVLSENRREGIVWAVITLALMFLWPVGMVFLYRKLSADKKAFFDKSVIMHSVGRTLSVLGWVMLFLIGLSMAGYIFLLNGDPKSPYVITFACLALCFCLLCCIGGIFMMIKAKAVKNRSLQYQRYINMVGNLGITSLEEISRLREVPLETVEADLQEMIDGGYFPNGRIDQKTKEIHIQHKRHIYDMETQKMVYNGAASSPDDIIPENVQKESRVKVVSCKSCGANNKILDGYHGECEYCGSHIE